MHKCYLSIYGLGIMSKLSSKIGKTTFVWPPRKTFNYRKCLSTGKPTVEQSHWGFNYNIKERKDYKFVHQLQEHWEQEGEIKDMWKCLGLENKKTRSATEFCSTKDRLG